MRIAILRDNNPDSSKKWELACKKKQIDYQVVDMLRDDWLNIIKKHKPDFCVSKPPGDISQNKQIFDNKLYFIENYLKLLVFPSFRETVIYENKSSLANFLKINNIPHPQTFVTLSKEEAMEFVRNSAVPFVAKTLIGAAGSGVKIIKNKEQAEEYVRTAFSTGIKRRFGPNRKTGNAKKWLKKAIKSPKYFVKKLKEYKNRNDDIQKGIVLFQEFIEHDYEWRCVKIGSSFFAYKKLKIGELSSGAKQFEYGAPPKELLDFTKDLCDKFSFNFMAVDIFYSKGKIYVNELQTIFGHKNPYICKVNDKPGRYLYKNNQWIFEPGDFNTNESYDLRLEHAINILHGQN